MNSTIMFFNETLVNISGATTQINYDEIIASVCQNVDERIKFLSLAIPLLFFAGNWFRNKCQKEGKLFYNMTTPIVAIPWPKWGSPWYEVEETSVRDLIDDILVPILKTMLIYAMGFLVYYVHITGGG